MEQGLSLIHIWLPLTAKAKIGRLSASILGRLADDELFAASVVLNTQLMLEEESDADGRPAPYRSELYVHTARIVEQGQREGLSLIHIYSTRWPKSAMDSTDSGS